MPRVAAMVEHHAMFYRDLADPVALLRGDRRADRLARYWPYAGAEQPAATAARARDAYTALMAASQPMIAAAGAGRLSFRRPSLPARHRRR